MRGRDYLMLSIILWLLLCIALTMRCTAQQDADEPIVITEHIPGDDIPAREYAWPNTDEFAEDDENVMIEQALIDASTLIADCRITYYCAEKYPHICNAGAPYLCADGTPPVPGVTCAADDIPLGATVMVMAADGSVEQYLRCTDRFGGKQKNHIDIVVATHNEALLNGVRVADVRWVVE